ncbi:MAG: Na/Pi cotransporter family protein [Lachnospiraceae bacterium]|nr:Na/Pi cotransporter family protein [Lachnospiraceae bacterium]
MGIAEVLSLAGGLGLFLLGMTQMSEGIEKAAGAKLRSVLEIFTSNRVMGMIVGVIFTAIIQSSSACTTMVVSFVNSGLMSLYQAAGVIFGANIGTTITGQLVSFNLSKYAPLFLLGGVIATMFSKNQKVKKLGDVVVGFGVLFMGIAMMSSAMESMRESGEIIEVLRGLTNPALAILVGMLITAVLQSSSVTVSIVLLMAQQGLFADINICLFIILGCNIGSCTTAMIASLAGNKEAKRAAMIHLLFNIIGTILIFIVLQLAMPGVSGLIRAFSTDDGRFVANAHSLFKVTQVLVLLPFSGWIVKLTYLIVPGKDQKVGYTDTFQLKYIGNKVLLNPSTAVVNGLKELERMASLADDNLNRAMNALITLDEDDIQKVYEMEKNIDFLNHAITGYLVKINQSTLPIEDLQGLGALFHVANDIERIGDHAENIAEMAGRRKETGVSFSAEAQKELTEMLELVNAMLERSLKVIPGTGSAASVDTLMTELLELENKVDDKEKELQQNHIERLTRQSCTPEAGMIFSDIASELERVADHALNIAAYMTKGDMEDAAEA